MSFAFCSVHEPSAISSCAASMRDGKIFLARGNQILTTAWCGGKWSEPIIRQIFGNITNICVIEDTQLTFLVLLLENEILYLFDVKEATFKCIQRSSFTNLVGDKVKHVLVSNSKYVIAHTRKRTLTIFEINSAKLIKNSFNAIVPFAKIHGIALLPEASGCDFCVLGRDVKGKLFVYFFKILDCNLEFQYSVSIDSEASDPCLIPLNDSKGFICAVGANKNIFFIQNEAKQTTMKTNIPEITCMTQINETLVMISDSVGGVYTAAMHGMSNMERKAFQITPSRSIVECPNNYFVQISETGDSHLLKFANRKLSVCDTYASINSSKCMLRSLFVTKSGTIRAIENGSLTANVANIELRNGTGIWSMNDLLVASTFENTVVLNREFEEDSEVPLIKDERTIALYSNEDIIVQVTQNHLLQINRMEVTKTDFANDVFVAATDGKSTVISYDNKIEVIGNESYTITIDECVTALAIKGKQVIAGTQKTNSVLVFEEGNIKESVELPKDSLLITSLMLYKDSKIIAATPNGIFIINGKQIQRIDSTHSISKLKLIDDRVFVCSDQSGFINENEKGDFSIEFVGKVPFNISIDAAMIDNNIAVLSEEGITVLFVERNYHSHITEQSVKDMVIMCAAVDEKDNCPPVFAAISNGENYLISPKLKPVSLPKGEIPSSMLWVIVEQNPYLAVLSENKGESVVSLYSPSLERCCEKSLSGKPGAITFVDSTFIAVAHGKALSILVPTKDDVKVNEEKSMTIFALTESSSVPTRTSCASLTSPNSCFIIYADEFSSVVLYTVVDGGITEVARDMTVRKLKYAAAVSNNQILAIDKAGDAFMLKINAGTLLTTGAFHLGSKFVAGFSSPPLTLCTESGSIICMLKCSEKELDLYRTMRTICKDCACESNSSWRSVIRNKKLISTDPFIDGDLLMMFESFTDDVKSRISASAKMSLDEITSIVCDLKKRVEDYRTKSQVGFSF